jgi:hypothetical protein
MAAYYERSGQSEYSPGRLPAEFSTEFSAILSDANSAFMAIATAENEQPHPSPGVRQERAMLAIDAGRLGLVLAVEQELGGELPKSGYLGAILCLDYAVQRIDWGFGYPRHLLHRRPGTWQQRDALTLGALAHSLAAQDHNDSTHDANGAITLPLSRRRMLRPTAADVACDGSTASLAVERWMLAERLRVAKIVAGTYTVAREYQAPSSQREAVLRLVYSVLPVV